MVVEQESASVVRSSVLSRVRMLEQESTNVKGKSHLADRALRESMSRRRSPRDKTFTSFSFKGDNVMSQEGRVPGRKSDEREKLIEPEKSSPTKIHETSSYKFINGNKIVHQNQSGKGTFLVSTAQSGQDALKSKSNGRQSYLGRMSSPGSISPFPRTLPSSFNQADTLGVPKTFPSSHLVNVSRNEHLTSPLSLTFDSRTPTMNNSSKLSSFRSTSLPRLSQTESNKSVSDHVDSNKSIAKPQRRSESPTLPRLQLAASPSSSARVRRGGAFEGKIQPKIPLSPKFYSINKERKQMSPSPGWTSFNDMKKSESRSPNVVALTWPTKQMEQSYFSKGGSTCDNSSSQEENTGPTVVGAKFSIDRSSVSSKTARVRNVRAYSPNSYSHSHLDSEVRRNLRAASQIMQEERKQGDSSSSSSHSSLSHEELSKVASRALSLSKFNTKITSRTLNHVNMNPEARSHRHQKSPIIQMLSEKRAPKGPEKPASVTYGSAARLTDRLTRADRFTALKKTDPSSEQNQQEQSIQSVRQLHSTIHPVFGYKKDLNKNLPDEKKPTPDCPSSPIMSPVRRSKHLSKAMRAKAEALAARATSRRLKDAEDDHFLRSRTNNAHFEHEKSRQKESVDQIKGKSMSSFSRNVEQSGQQNGYQKKTIGQPIHLPDNHSTRLDERVSGGQRQNANLQAKNFLFYDRQSDHPARPIEFVQPNLAISNSTSSEEDIEVIAMDSNEDQQGEELERRNMNTSKPLHFHAYGHHLFEINKRDAGKRELQGDKSSAGSASSEEDMEVIATDSYEDDDTSSAYTSGDETTQLREIVNQRMQAYRFQQQKQQQQILLQQQKLQKQQQQRVEHAHQQFEMGHNNVNRTASVKKVKTPSHEKKLSSGPLIKKQHLIFKQVDVPRTDGSASHGNGNDLLLNQERKLPETSPEDLQITPDSVFLTAFESSSAPHGDSSDPNTFTGSLNKTDALVENWFNKKYGSEQMSIHKPVSRLSPKIINIDENHVVQKIIVDDDDDIFEGLEDDSVIPEPGTSNDKSDQKAHNMHSRTIVPPPIDTGVHEENLNPKPPAYWTKVVEVQPKGKHSGKMIDENIATKSVASDITSSLIAGKNRIISSLYRRKQGDTIVEEEATLDGEDDDEENSIQLEGSTDETIQDEDKNKTSESMLINLSCAIVNSIKNACVVPDKSQLSCAVPEQLSNVSSCALNAKVPSCALAAKAKVEEKINEAWKSIDHEESCLDGDDESNTTFGQSTAAGERTLNTNDITTVQEETTVTEEGPRQVSDSGSSANTCDKKKHDQSRRKAQQALDEHVKNAMQKYEYKQVAEESEYSISEGPKVLDDVLSPASIGRLSAALSFEQRAVLEKFSSKLKSEGIEVLKLGRRHKWQVRYLTVSQEVIGIATNDSPSDIGQCPKALLWLKQQSSRNHSIETIKEHGRGGVFFTNLKRVKQTSSCASYTKYLPKKLKADFPAFHGVEVDYIFDNGDERQLYFCFKTNLDAQAFCTAMQIIKEVADRGTLKESDDFASFSTKSPSGSEEGS